MEEYEMEMLSTTEMSALTKELIADAAAARPDLKAIFCKNWPIAKEAIDAALKIVKNPIALLVLKVVEVIGDELFTALGCKQGRSKL
jgi:hypothetical protein